MHPGPHISHPYPLYNSPMKPITLGKFEIVDMGNIGKVPFVDVVCHGEKMTVKFRHTGQFSQAYSTGDKAIRRSIHGRNEGEIVVTSPSQDLLILVWHSFGEHIETIIVGDEEFL